MWYIGQLATAVKFNTDFFSCALMASFCFQLWSSGFWPRGSSVIMKPIPVRFRPLRQRKQPECRLSVPCSRGNAAIDPAHSSTHPPLSFSTGALYSRKVTLEGEEVSLQIQDTPCVALQVTNGGTEAARRFSCATVKLRYANQTWLSALPERPAPPRFWWAKLIKKGPKKPPKNMPSFISIFVRNAFEVRDSSSPMMNLMSATCHMAHPTVYKTKASVANFLRGEGGSEITMG